MIKDNILGLKINGAELEDMNPTDLGILLLSFSKILGGDDASFESIRSGCVLIEVKIFDRAVAEKQQRLLDAIRRNTSHYLTIQKLLNKNPSWQSIDFSLRKSGQPDDCATVIHTVIVSAPAITFSQRERKRGTVSRLLKGSDATDHASIITDDGHPIPFELSAPLAAKLANYFGTDVVVEVHGEAKYALADCGELTLEKFKVDHIEVIESSDISTWLHGFKNLGKSGWSQSENPIEQWLEDRLA